MPDSDTVIARRYPSVFPSGHVGAECGPGWTAIIEAVALVMQGRANATSSTVPAIQIKEKHGTLRVYYEGSDLRVDGAIDFVEVMSLRVCEDTGMFGALMSKGGWLRVVSPSIAASRGYTFRDGRAMEDIKMPTMEQVLHGRGAAMSRCGLVAVPPGLHHLVDALLQVIDVEDDCDLRIHSIGWRDGLLTVEATGKGAFDSGAIACAIALSRHVDPTTGELTTEIR